MLPNINKFRNKILYFFQKVSQMWLLNCLSYCDTCLESCYFFQEMPSIELIPLLFFNRYQNWVHLPVLFIPCLDHFHKLVFLFWVVHVFAGLLLQFYRCLVLCIWGYVIHYYYSNAYVSVKNARTSLFREWRRNM